MNQPIAGRLLASTLLTFAVAQQATAQTFFFPADGTKANWRIACYANDPVYAMSSGFITALDSTGRVTVDHGNGYQSILKYVTIDPTLKVGSFVDDGQKLGTVMKSDRSVYFQIYRWGQPLPTPGPEPASPNPNPWGIVVENSDPIPASYPGLAPVTPVANPPLINSISVVGRSEHGGVAVPVTVNAAASVVGVQFLLDGVALGPEVTTLPFSTSLVLPPLDFSFASRGYTLAAVGRHASGTQCMRSQGIFVYNTATVGFVTLEASGAASGTVPVLMGVTGDNLTGHFLFANKFVLSIDGQVVSTQTSSNPFTKSINSATFQWDTTRYTNGQHTLGLVVTDVSGHFAGLVQATATNTGTVSNPGHVSQVTITGINPTSGVLATGTYVTITCAGLSPECVAYVTVSNVVTPQPLTDLVVVSSTQITGNVSSTNYEGPADVSIWYKTNLPPRVSLVATLPSAFTLLKPPPITITSVTPSTGPATGGTVLDIKGTNLDQARGVDFGNSALTNVTILSPNELLATTQATGFPSTTPLQLHISDATVSGYGQGRFVSAFAYTKSTSPLMASFAAPAPGATVSGTTIINMSTLGAVGAYNGGNWIGVRYSLWLDETTFLWGSETNPAAISVQFAWNTTKVADGSHTLKLYAYDASDRSTTTTVTCTVKNH